MEVLKVTHYLPPNESQTIVTCLQAFAVTSSVVNDDGERHHGGEDADFESYDAQDRENL